MPLELDPPQPPEVADAIEAIVATPVAPDPWWEAGVREALADTDDPAPPQIGR